KDGAKLYVCTFKSNSGPNPANGPAPNTKFVVTRSWPLEKAQLNIMPVPNNLTLFALSRQVDANNGITNRKANPMMAFLRSRIEHVIYIVKETRLMIKFSVIYHVATGIRR